uniref:Uncharacterized protein n=1 Tax=Clytia hemisphaerica TaxID=252671 RepID=A0A7M5X2Z4_9CNID
MEWVNFTTPILEALTAFNDINIADPRTNHEQTKSSMETTLDIKLKEKLLGRFSYDTVIVMKGKKWSDYTKDQVESFERRWTEMGVLKGLNTEACLLLTKSHRDDSCAIRVSFTQIEKSLCQQRSTNEKLVYFIFKSMFYKHIKVLNKPGDSTISSFLGKNVMFWVLHDNTDSLQKNIVEALKILFGRLNAMITSGDAPYYLMTTINIVDTMPREVKHKLEQRINEILANIEDYIPSVQDIEVVTEKLRKLGQLSKTFAQLLKIQGALSDKLGERTNIETFLSNGMVQNILGKIADVN